VTVFEKNTVFEVSFDFWRSNMSKINVKAGDFLCILILICVEDNLAQISLKYEFSENISFLEQELDSFIKGNIREWLITNGYIPIYSILGVHMFSKDDLYNFSKSKNYIDSKEGGTCFFSFLYEYDNGQFQIGRGFLSIGQNIIFSEDEIRKYIKDTCHNVSAPKIWCCKFFSKEEVNSIIKKLKDNLLEILASKS
jgi:hypothetical protein